MDNMTATPSRFDGMRSFEDHEMNHVLDLLFDDRDFCRILRRFVPSYLPLRLVRLYLRRFRTIDSLQKNVIIPALYNAIDSQITSLDWDFDGLPAAQDNLLFISNHRDIVLDSAFLDKILQTNGWRSAEIAIGNNLLIYPWIERLVRLNRCFSVNRSASAQELLESSGLLSEYIRYVIEQKKSPVWLAQREGRAKDSDDRTQKSVLKMLAMSGQGNILERLASLHITPLSISYEFDPCDWLKAKEFQNKRDIPGFKKSRQDDLDNMQTGIAGYKGRIFYKAWGPIDNEILALAPNQPRNVILQQVADIIDRHIFQGYRLYPCNFIAADMLHADNAHSDRYTGSDRQAFEKYIDGQLAKIATPDADIPFLKERILTMYANPLINYENTGK